MTKPSLRSDDYKAGYATGSKASQRHKPQPLQVDLNGNPRPKEWIEGMLAGYHKGNKVGRPKSDRSLVQTRIDETLRLKAIDAGISRDLALELGIRLLCSDLEARLLKALSSRIASIKDDDGEQSVTVVDVDRRSYSAPTKLEALLLLIE